MTINREVILIMALESILKSKRNYHGEVTITLLKEDYYPVEADKLEVDLTALGYDVKDNYEDEIGSYVVVNVSKYFA